MPWARLEDIMDEHPKLVGLSDGAFAMEMRAILYSARVLTDGFIAKHLLKRLTSATDIAVISAQVKELVESRLWEPEGDGYRIHDYAQYQPTREQVLARRAADAERKRKGHKTRAQVGNGTAAEEPSTPESSEDSPVESDTECPAGECPESTSSRPGPVPARKDISSPLPVAAPGARARARQVARAPPSR
jgi:hypothetical protein